MSSEQKRGPGAPNKLGESVRVTARVPLELVERLDELVTEGRTRSDAVREAIEAGLRPPTKP